MKIMCQEHYDKVVQYAKEIGDKSLNDCLERLKKWGREFELQMRNRTVLGFCPLFILFQTTV